MNDAEAAAPTSAIDARDAGGFIERRADGICVVDTGFHRPRFDAAYLIVERGRGAFVDTGTNHSVPRLLAALDDAGLRPEDVDHVIATHVHLDHAGGVGLLMQSLPKAQLVVHPHGAQHLIDPERLTNGARAVYGDEEVERSYGRIAPVPAERVRCTEDGLHLDFAGRTLVFIDTPGHARHHHCIWDETSRGFFTGDTFGLSYREFDTEQGAWIMPTTTPVQFEPERLRASVGRILAFAPQQLYLTHYGAVGDVPRLGRLFLAQLASMVALAERLAAQGSSSGGERHEALRDGLFEIHLDSLRRHGCRLDEERIRDLLALDLELNAQGIGTWLDRRSRRHAS